MLFHSSDAPFLRASLGRLVVYATFLLVGRCSPSVHAAEAPRPVTVAVVKDGSSWLIDATEAAFRREAQTLTTGRAALVFKSDAAFDAQWSDAGAAAALDAALADPAVDYVFTLGVRATVAAAAPDRTLPKPVLGALVQESDLVRLPVSPDGRAQKPNFAVVALPSRAIDQLAELRDVVPFTALHILIDEFLAADRAALSAWRDQLARELNAAVTLVPLASSADETLRALPADARTVLLFPAIRMDGPNRAALLQGLTAR
jgi:outer membrane protein